MNSSADGAWALVGKKLRVGFCDSQLLYLAYWPLRVGFSDSQLHYLVYWRLRVGYSDFQHPAGMRSG
ncbi:hypothetical protein SAMN05518855_102268 [Paenibacillus sp. CF384]|nr:hypothetical protein SAMN05518855_102268 [Paenibacillus sp. CF384]